MRKILILISFFLLNCGGGDSPTSSEPEVIALKRFYHSDYTADCISWDGSNICNGEEGIYRHWVGFSIFSENFSNVNDYPGLNPWSLRNSGPIYDYTTVTLYQNRDFINYHIDEGYVEFSWVNNTTGTNSRRLNISDIDGFQYQVK